MRSTCVQHLKMMAAVVLALNEFELIFLNRPEKNSLAQQQADESYEAFVSQRTAIYFRFVNIPVGGTSFTTATSLFGLVQYTHSGRSAVG